MKRKLFAALTSVALSGAALWGVNYRLDHPPLTKADREFRALIAGADSIEASQNTVNGLIESPRSLGVLDAMQTRELIETLRFVDVERDVTALASAGSTIELDLNFKKKDETLADCTLIQTQHHSILMYISRPILYNHCLSSRSQKSLNRVLDAYLPQRVRP